MNVCRHLSQTARLLPDSIALEFEGHRWTYAELDRRSRAAAMRLLDAEVNQGDRVALVLPNTPAFPVWYFAAVRVGAVAVSISTRSADPEVGFVMEDCAPKVIVAQREIPSGPHRLNLCVNDFGESDDNPLDAADTIPPDDGELPTICETAPDDPAAILYTSGTTGHPKGAVLSHANVGSNVCAFNHLCQTRPEDRLLLAVPLFHCFGQNALLNAGLSAGCTIVLQRQFDLTEARRLIATHQITQLYGVPMLFRLLLDHADVDELSSVNYCFSAAATLPVQTGQAWEEKFGMPIHEGYGLTETSPFASYNHRLRFVRGSIGMPIDGCEMKIVDRETGRECPPGALGEIAIRGPNVMLGYWNRPEDTAAVIQDGWFHSGDIGRVDRDGYFFLVDRVKDMITVGGMKVYPAEVERILLDHPAVAQAAVVGHPDDVFGEQVIAFVVFDADFAVGTSGSTEAGDSEAGTSEAEPTEAELETLAEIRSFAAEHLATYKSPRFVIPIAELPRNPSGKVLKTALRQQALPLWAQGPAPSATAEKDGLRDRVANAYPNDRQRVAETFVQEMVMKLTDETVAPDPTIRFLDAGLDSLAIVEMGHLLQSEMGDSFELSATLIFDYPRICDLAGLLVERIVDASSEHNPVARDAASGPADRSTGQAPAVDSAQLLDEIRELTDEEARAQLLRELSE